MLIVCMTEDGSIHRTRITELKQNKQTFFKGWYCETGLHSVSIKVRGAIRNTICRQPNENRICEIRNCWCGADMHIPKAIDEPTLKLFKTRVKELDPNTIPRYKQGTLVAVGRHDKVLENEFNIDWNILRRCNYDCSYCPPRIHDNNSPYPEIQTLKDTYNKLDIPEGRDITITLTGGEPTLWADLLDFVIWLKAQRTNTRIEILTNGTASIRKMIALHKETDFVISLHHEYFTDKFFAKIESFLDQTPYNNRVDFKSYEYGDTIDFQNKISKHNFVGFSSNIPIVNKDTGVWDKENN